MGAGKVIALGNSRNRRLGQIAQSAIRCRGCGGPQIGLGRHALAVPAQDTAQIDGFDRARDMDHDL